MSYKLTTGWPLNITTGAYVNPENNPEYLAWLSEGNTPAKADPIIRDIKSEIAQLETQQMMPRVTREFMLSFTEAAYTPEQLALNIGYTKLKAFDEEVKALRELL